MCVWIFWVNLFTIRRCIKVLCRKNKSLFCGVSSFPCMPLTQKQCKKSQIKRHFCEGLQVLQAFTWCFFEPNYHNITIHYSYWTYQPLFKRIVIISIWWFAKVVISIFFPWKHWHHENLRRVRTLDIVGGFWSAETRQYLDLSWAFFCFAECFCCWHTSEMCQCWLMLLVFNTSFYPTFFYPWIF